MLWSKREQRLEVRGRHPDRAAVLNPNKMNEEGWDIYTRGVRPHLEGKQMTPLSSQVETDISWSPLSGLQGAKLPVDFGDRTRYCSPGPAEKEGPLLAMTGASHGFSRAASHTQTGTSWLPENGMT